MGRTRGVKGGVWPRLQTGVWLRDPRAVGGGKGRGLWGWPPTSPGFSPFKVGDVWRVRTRDADKTRVRDAAPAATAVVRAEH